MATSSYAQRPAKGSHLIEQYTLLDIFVDCKDLLIVK